MIAMVVIAVIILFLILVILRQINAKLRRFSKKQKILIDIFIVMLVLGGVLWWINQINRAKAAYTQDMILTWDTEYGGESIDPATFEKSEFKEEEFEDVEDMEREVDKVYNEEVVIEEEENSIVEKDFYEILRIFGAYRFATYIKMDDLNYFQEKCSSYFENRQMESVGNPSDEEYKVIQNRIERYDQALGNQKSLSSKEHMQNSNDRWEMFIRDKNLGMLEQSAISAEAAVQEEEGKEDFPREDLYRFIRTTVDRFRLRLDYDMDDCMSGEKSDLQYRIGKVLYKPAVILDMKERQDKFYSLCTAYSILKEACNNSKDDSVYAVETAYYYFLVCAEVVKNMEDVPEEMKEEIVKAHDLFGHRGKLHPENATYRNYWDSSVRVRYEIEELGSNGGISPIKRT